MKKDKGYIELEKIGFPATSVFETMRSYDGRIFKFEEHIERLYASAKTMGFKIHLSKDKLKKKILEELKQSALKDAYIRVCIFGADSHLQIMVKPLPEYPAEYYQHGVSIITVAGRKNIPLAVESRIKSGDFLWGVMGKIEAYPTQGVFEILYLNHQGYVAEGSVSNIFLVKARQLITPTSSSGILEGITARTVMGLAKKMKIDLIRQPITRHQLYNADEVFLTNTTVEVMPVAKIDGRSIGQDCPGRLTSQLHKAYIKLTCN